MPKYFNTIHRQIGDSYPYVMLPSIGDSYPYVMLHSICAVFSALIATPEAISVIVEYIIICFTYDTFPYPM